MRRTLRLLLLLLVTLVSVGRADAASGSLVLSNGDSYSGDWLDCKAADRVRWQPTFTRQPYEFPWDVIANAKLPPPAKEIKQIGSLRFDLVGGNMLIGDLVEVSPDWLTVSVVLDPQRGAESIRIARNRVRSIVRADGAGGALYMGPDPLSKWKTNSEDHWRYTQGTLGTSTENSIATRRVILSKQALLEVELSWKNKVDFSLELGLTKARQQALVTGLRTIAKANQERLAIGRQIAQPALVDGNSPDAPNSTDAFRLETIANHLVVVRETNEAIDLTPLQELKPGAGNIQLRLYLDQPKNRLIVTTTTGEQLADLQVPGATRLFGSGLLLHNRGGDIQLDKLTVSQWNGDPPVNVKRGQHFVTLVDGKVVHGEVVGYDAEAKRLLIAPPASDEDRSNRDEGDKDETQELTDPETSAETDNIESTSPDAPPPTEVDIDKVASIVFPNRLLGGSDEPSSEKSLVTATLHTGHRVTGTAHGVAAQKIELAVPHFKEPISLPLSAVRTVRATQQAKQPAEKKRLPLLEIDGTQSVGTLSAAKDNGAESCLLWRPEGSLNAVQLLDSVSGRIVFREPARPKPQTQPAGAPVVRNRGFLGVIGNMFLGNQPATPTTPSVTGPSATEPAVMYLRHGDKLPCKVDRIDKQGVHFSSPFSTSDFAAHEHIKAIELISQGVDGRVTSDRREQLLTLPRMQTQNPPTHLLVSTQGDYLRCRLMSLTEERAIVEVRLEDTAIERSRIARIIWLDPPPKQEEVESQDRAAVPLVSRDLGSRDPANHPRVQAVRRDGVRLTFNLEKIVGASDAAASDESILQLVGVSDVLEACHVKLAEIDVLLLGVSIEHAAAELSYQRWKMQHAIEPRDPVASEPGDASTSFPLVGKPAPEIKLPYYADGAKPPGKQFQISDYQGRVLVLDFWASWCGPCMQAMPVLHALGEEFADQRVQVVAVNLQDSPKEINAALNRLKIEPLIALDRDGVAAQRYQVTGIPQTVVIDQDGKVANVFVGGGGSFGDRVRAAIQAALDGKPVPETPGE